MLLAGLTGFLNADADNMKAEVAAKRKAEADRLAGITGWRKKVAENAMKNSNEQESTINLTIGNATAWVAEIGGKLKTESFRDELSKMDEIAFRDIASKYNVSLATIFNKAKEQQVDMGSIDINGLYSYNIMEELSSARNQSLNALQSSLGSASATINKDDGKVITFDVNPND